MANLLTADVLSAYYEVITLHLFPSARRTGEGVFEFSSAREDHGTGSCAVFPNGRDGGPYFNDIGAAPEGEKNGDLIRLWEINQGVSRDEAVSQIEQLLRDNGWSESTVLPKVEPVASAAVAATSWDVMPAGAPMEAIPGGIMEDGQIRKVTYSAIYRNPDGCILGLMLRADYDGKKTVRHRLAKYEDGRIKWDFKGFRGASKPLYGMERLSAGPRPVCLVEGEKKADAGNAWLLPGFAVLGWANGAKAAPEVDLSPLRGRIVYLWPDNDAPGREAMTVLASRLEGVAASVFWIEPPADKPEGWDLDDAHKDGWTQAQTEAYVRSASRELTEKVDLFDTALEGIYFSKKGKYFALMKDDHTWIEETESGMQRYLRTKGVSGQTPKGATSSPMDLCLQRLRGQPDRMVEGIIPFPCNPERIVKYKQKRYLNSSNVVPMQPAEAPGEFPWLTQYFETLIPDQRNRDHFFSWLQHWYKTTLAGEPTWGQAIFIAGESGTGKSLLSRTILGWIFGGSESATKVLVGGKQFAAGLFDRAVWTIDDADQITDRRVHTRFTGAVKALVANQAMEYDEKYGFSGEVPFTGRLVVTLNLDASSLSVLPDLTQSTADKFNIYRAGSKKLPIPEDAMILSELPYFLRWLVDWTRPEWVKSDGRFGIESFQDGTLEEAARENSTEGALVSAMDTLRQEWIETWRSEPATRNKPFRKQMTSAELLQVLQTNPATSNQIDRRMTAVGFGRRLGSIDLDRWCPWLKPTRVGQARTRGWEIDDRPTPEFALRREAA